MSAPFRDRLVSELTQLDIRKQNDRNWNRHFIGIALGAVADVVDMISAGATEAEAFADCFTPSREMHSVARRLELPLTVDRGRWIAGV